MENQRIISLRSIITFIIMVGVIILAIYSIDILLMLFASFVITCAINPFINKMEKKMPRVWAVTLILFALILTSFLIIVPLITISVREAVNLANSFPNLIDSIDKILNFKIFNREVSSFITFESLKEPLTQGAHSIIENSIVFGKKMAGGLCRLL